MGIHRNRVSNNQTLDLQSIIIILSENNIGGVSESTELPYFSIKLF